jgi:hypothetical protein
MAVGVTKAPFDGMAVGVTKAPFDGMAVGVSVGVICCAAAEPKFESVPAAATSAARSRAGRERDTDAFLRCKVDGS